MTVLPVLILGSIETMLDKMSSAISMFTANPFVKYAYLGIGLVYVVPQLTIIALAFIS